MALSPSMRRRLCRHCHCNFRPYDDGLVAIVDAQAPLPSLRWCCLPCNNRTVAPDPRQCCCPCHDCIVAILKLVLLHSLQWCCCHDRCHCPCCLSASWHCRRQCAGVFAIVAMAIVALITMASLPLLMRRRVCVVVKLALSPLPLVVKLVSSPTLRWHCFHLCAGFFFIVLIAFFSLMTMVLSPLLMHRRLCCC
jgi:hypothetical protein